MVVLDYFDQQPTHGNSRQDLLIGLGIFPIVFILVKEILIEIDLRFWFHCILLCYRRRKTLRERAALKANPYGYDAGKNLLVANCGKGDFLRHVLVFSPSLRSCQQFF